MFGPGSESRRILDCVVLGAADFFAPMDISDDLLSPQIPPDRIKIVVEVKVIQGQTERCDSKSYVIDQGLAYTGGILRMENMNRRAELLLLGLGSQSKGR